MQGKEKVQEENGRNGKESIKKGVEEENGKGMEDEREKRWERVREVLGEEDEGSGNERKGEKGRKKVD